MWASVLLLRDVGLPIIQGEVLCYSMFFVARWDVLAEDLWNEWMVVCFVCGRFDSRSIFGQQFTVTCTVGWKFIPPAVWYYFVLYTILQFRWNELEKSHTYYNVAYSPVSVFHYCPFSISSVLYPVRKIVKMRYDRDGRITFRLTLSMIYTVYIHRSFLHPDIPVSCDW